MSQADNDLEQLKDVRHELAKVYKTQAADEIHDNGNLEHIHKAILHVEDAIATLEGRGD